MKQQFAPLERAQWPKTKLPEDWNDEYVKRILFNFRKAYAEVFGDAHTNFKRWDQAQEGLFSLLMDKLELLGVHCPPWTNEDLRSRLMLEGVSQAEMQPHLRLWRAVFTDATETFWRQSPYRYWKKGNTHTDITGGTGLGKSTEAGTILIVTHYMMTGEHLPPDQLLDHFGTHIADRIDKLPRIRTGSTYVDDDETEIAGEGAMTLQKSARNTAGQLRFSKKSLVRIAPEIEAHSTTQGRLEAWMVDDPIAYIDGIEVREPWWEYPPFLLEQLEEQGRLTLHCPKCKYPWRWQRCQCGWYPWTLNMFWIGMNPVGLVGIEWMPPEHYAKYGPWKAESNKRIQEAQTGDSNFYARIAVRACQDPTFQKWFSRKKAKYNATEVETGLKLSKLPMLSGEQLGSIASFMHAAFSAWDEFGEPLFKEMGIEPTVQMRLIAKRFKPDGA